ncbi:MAG: prolyl oligopeptidase family serine peptidase [Mycobacteriales bacterium]
MSRPLDPETLAYRLSIAGEPQIRPDGSELVYSLSTVDASTHQPRSRLWSCAIDGTQAHPLTSTEQNASGPRWSPDGTRIAHTTVDDRGAALVVLDPRPGTEVHQITHHTQDIAGLAWSPDGQRIAYTTLFDPDNPGEDPEPPGAAPQVRVTRRLDYKEDGRGYLGDRRRQVFVADVSGASSRRLTSEPVDHDAPQWSPDGGRIATRVHLRDHAGMQLVLLDVETGRIERIGPGEGMVEHWSWSPSGEHIFFAADPEQTLQPDYYLYRRADKHIRRLTTDLRSSPDDSPPVWLDTSRVLVHAVHAGASRLELVDVDSGDVHLLATHNSRNTGLSVDRTGRYIAQSQATPTSIGEICVQDRELGLVATVTDHNAAVLAERPPASWETFQVRRGEFTIDAWLLKPPDFDPTCRYPVVLDVHGGPSANYGYGFLAHEQCLATNGFLVVYANPRGSTSYGRHFAEQVVRDWGGGDYEDVLAVLDTLLERPYADRDRTGIFGISYGGYLTSWAIGHSDRFAAAVCGEPIFDLESDYGTSDVAFNGLEHHGGGPPHVESQWYAAHSPSTYAHRTRTPTLIFHGEADNRCPIGQSEQMFVALRKADCEVEFARYPGGSHMFFAQGLPEHRADFLARTLAWFKDHLGEPSPASPNLDRPAQS